MIPEASFACGGLDHTLHGMIPRALGKSIYFKKASFFQFNSPEPKITQLEIHSLVSIPENCYKKNTLKLCTQHALGFGKGPVGFSQ